MAALGSHSRVASVAVSLGDSVEAGEILVVLDDAAASGELARLRAEHAAAEATVRVLDDGIGELADRRSEIRDQRSTVRSTISELERTLADLRQKRAEAASALNAAEGMLRQLPPGAPVPPTLPKPARLRAGIAKLDQAIARLSSGLSQARDATVKLGQADTKVADARADILRVRDIARVAVDARAVAVDLGRYQLEQHVLRAPTAGVVVSLPNVGAVLADGAHVVELRVPGAARVASWLPLESAGSVRLGDGASVSVDSRPGRRFPASVVLLGESAMYPPTSFATDEIHLMRAVAFEIRLDDASVSLPEGTPATVRLVRGLGAGEDPR